MDSMIRGDIHQVTCHEITIYIMHVPSIRLIPKKIVNQSDSVKISRLRKVISRLMGELVDYRKRQVD